LESFKKAIDEPQSKYVTSEVEVQLACRLLFVDMEGLNDGRAVKTIVPQVNPRKMVSFLCSVSLLLANWMGRSLCMLRQRQPMPLLKAAAKFAQ
jgi:hypothetical protein